ncbi:MAG: hypothetical protein IPM33_01390 [Phycisphaerales bacterium]|nr:hypothetical protein [Phycisphaerales bacterium]
MPSERTKALLFTAFEPSGDEHAAAVIAELRARHPDLVMYAWGGRAMQAAGATIIEQTGDDAVMGMPGLAKIREHQRINTRIDAFLGEHPEVVMHIPVDSPAANGPICDIAKGRGLKVVHLVAPQIWAWGRWRIHTLRKRTDLLLCLLPFEEEFFRKRNVPARFIGHFLFDQPVVTSSDEALANAFPEGEPRLALMPGSRPDELRRHFPVLLEAFRDLRQRHQRLVGVVAATTPGVAQWLRTMADEHGGWPEGLGLVVGQTDDVIRWCDLALVKSGTVTLQVARQARPMVVFYQKANALVYLMARVILSTRLFSLPNLLARRRIVPELVPHYGGAGPIVREADRLLTQADRLNLQVADLKSVAGAFIGRHAARAAADEIERLACLDSPQPAACAC